LIDIGDEEASEMSNFQQGTIHRIIRRPMVRIPGRGGGYVNVVSRVPVQGSPGIIRRQIPMDRNVRYFPAPPNFRRADTIMKSSEIGIGEDVDPDFQRIEANLMKAEHKCRKELESQRFSGISNIQSRLTGGVPQEVRLLTQKLLHAKSNLEVEEEEDDDGKEIKNVLNEIITSVCNKDNEEGWHRDILRKIRSSVVPVMHSGRITGPQVKRSNHRALETLVAEKCDALKKHILKRRAVFELSVEYDNQFIKKTRSGAIVCVPYGQTYARIGASWPQEPAVAEVAPPESTAREPEHSASCENLEPIVKLEPVSEFSPIQESKKIPNDFPGSPTRTSGRQPSRLKRLSPGVEESPAKSLIQSICHNGVSIIPPIDMKDIRKSKPGRPSNKDRRKMERQIAIQRKKLTKTGSAKATVSIEFDVNACHCICRQPYDPKKFYMACNGCKRWFHGKCMNVTEKKAKKLQEWYCTECSPNDAQDSKKKKKSEYTEAESIDGVFCLCRKPYDPSKDYIGCDVCKDWFHFECVKVTHEQTRQINQYVCPICREPEAILEAVKAMQEHEYAGLFSRDIPDGEEFRSRFPDLECIEDIVDNVHEGKYPSLQDFRNEVSTLYTTVSDATDEDHILHKAIKEITTTASDVLLNALPDHPYLP